MSSVTDQPEYAFRPLHNVLNGIEGMRKSGVLKGEVATRAANVVVAAPTEASAVAANVLFTPFQVAGVILGLGARFVAFISGIQAVKDFQEKMPTVTDFLRTVAKIVAFSIGTSLDVTVGVISPKANFKAHVYLGLIRNQKADEKERTAQIAMQALQQERQAKISQDQEEVNQLPHEETVASDHSEASAEEEVAFVYEEDDSFIEQMRAAITAPIVTDPSEASTEAIVIPAQEEVVAAAEEEVAASQEEVVEEAVSSSEEEVVASSEEEVEAPQEEAVASSEGEVVASSEEEVVASQEEEVVASAEDEVEASQEEAVASAEEEAVASSEEEAVASAEEEAVASSEEEVVAAKTETRLDQVKAKLLTARDYALAHKYPIVAGAVGVSTVAAAVIYREELEAQGAFVGEFVGNYYNNLPSASELWERHSFDTSRLREWSRWDNYSFSDRLSQWAGYGNETQTVATVVETQTDANATQSEESYVGTAVNAVTGVVSGVATGVATGAASLVTGTAAWFQTQGNWAYDSVFGSANTTVNTTDIQPTPVPAPSTEANVPAPEANVAEPEATAPAPEANVAETEVTAPAPEANVTA